MIIRFVSIGFFVSFTISQWAFLGESTDENNLGRYTGKNLWPSARGSSRSTFDSYELYVFGGKSSANNLCDLWILNIETIEWRLLGPFPNPQTFQGSLVDQGTFSSKNWPVPLYFISMFTRGELLYIFPGYNGADDYYPTFFIYNKTSNQWFYDVFQVPVGIRFNSMYFSFVSFLDLDSNSFYLIGAVETIFAANMRTLEFSIYTAARYSFPLVLSSSFIVNDSIYIFGGAKDNNFAFNSLYKVNFTSNEVIQLNMYNTSTLIKSYFGPSGSFNQLYFPSGRYGSFIQFRRNKNQLLMFGGNEYSPEKYYADLWIFDLNSTAWAYLSGPTDPNVSFNYKKKGIPSDLNHPGSRSFGASIFDELKQRLYIFGGTSAPKSYHNDLWVYYFDYQINPSTKSSFATVITSVKTPRVTDTDLSEIIQDSISQSRLSFPMWALATIVVGSIAFLVVLFALSIRKRKAKRQSRIDFSSIKDPQQTETMVNTNVGLSDHLSFRKESDVFEKIKTLNRGGQAEICLVKVKDAKVVQAIGSKEAVQKIFLPSQYSKEILLHEVSIMVMLRKYPFFVTIVAYTLDPLSLVMKYYPEGSLDEWILRNNVTAKLNVKFSFEIASALKTMHSHDLAHCDLKCQNILIDCSKGEPQCCMSDFGITQVLSDSIIAVKQFNVLNIKGLSCHHASPESFLGIHTKKNWNFKKGDIYSYGCTMYEILTSKYPWE